MTVGSAYQGEGSPLGDGPRKACDGGKECRSLDACVEATAASKPFSLKLKLWFTYKVANMEMAKRR